MNYYNHIFIEYTSLKLPKGTHCLNLITYYGVSIKNTYCYQPPLIVT